MSTLNRPHAEKHEWSSTWIWCCCRFCFSFSWFYYFGCCCCCYCYRRRCIRMFLQYYWIYLINKHGICSKHRNFLIFRRNFESCIAKFINFENIFVSRGLIVSFGIFSKNEKSQISYFIWLSQFSYEFDLFSICELFKSSHYYSSQNRRFLWDIKRFCSVLCNFRLSPYVFFGFSLGRHDPFQIE